VPDAVLFILRSWLGVVMLAHGFHHARSLEGTRKWFSSKGFRAARLAALGSAVGELAIGGAMVLGFLTSVACAGIVIVTVMAFWTVHRSAGFYVFKRPDEGWEYVATLTVVATVIAWTGPGRYSLDSALGWAELLDGPIGIWIVVGGVAMAATQLAIFWHNPQD
jgi:putative oxidoreductase